jgi:hypothetical protein
MIAQMLIPEFISAWSHLVGGFNDLLPIISAYYNSDLIKLSNNLFLDVTPIPVG